MERQTNELLFLMLLAILAASIALIYWFGRSGKRKSSHSPHPIPFWRRWRPSDPSRCDCCRAEAIDNAMAQPLPAVEAWSSRKSKRGRKKRVDSAGYFCPNPDCNYHQNPDPSIHALASNGRHGQQAIRQWREACQACGTYVSERHDTAMSNLKKPLEDVSWTLEMLNRGTSQADTAAHHRHDPRTIRSWLKRGAAQAMRVHDAYFQNLKLGNLQLDELVGDVKGASSHKFIWTALDAVTKIVPVWHIGPRRLQDAQLVVHQLKLRLAPDCIPIFTSDQLRSYFTALTSHFGEFRQEWGRRKLVWRVSPKLLYAQLIKIRSGRRLKFAITLPIFGTRGQIRDALQALGLSGRIQTAFVERANLTLRQLISALHRRTWSLPWSTTTFDYRLTWFFAFYHFCRPHQTLAGSEINGITFRKCTPAIAAGLTDHIWSLDEILLWRPKLVST